MIRLISYKNFKPLQDWERRHFIQCIETNTMSRKMKWAMFQSENNIEHQKDISEMERSDLPDKEFKTMVLKMLVKVWRTEHVRWELQQRENVRRFPIETMKWNNTTIELRTPWEGFTNRLSEKPSKTGQQNPSTRRAKRKKTKNGLRDFRILSGWQIFTLEMSHRSRERMKGSENFPNLRKEKDIQIQEPREFQIRRIIQDPHQDSL